MRQTRRPQWVRYGLVGSVAGSRTGGLLATRRLPSCRSAPAALNGVPGCIGRTHHETGTTRPRRLHLSAAARGEAEQWAGQKVLVTSALPGAQPLMGRQRGQ